MLFAPDEVRPGWTQSGKALVHPRRLPTRPCLQRSRAGWDPKDRWSLPTDPEETGPAVVAPKQVYAAFLTNITRVLSESRAPTIRRTTQRNLLSVPIGWIAVGDPAKILPPNRHEAIWALQEPLNFPGFVYGFDRDTRHGAPQNPSSVVSAGRAGGQIWSRSGSTLHAETHSFAAQWLAYALPCRRFVRTLTGTNARLRVEAVRYSFLVMDLHHLLLAGLPAHSEQV
jgi:hypothetical protein